jgi:putative sporulation protein YtaF
MHILSILFFCIASSSDSFVIGLSYGSKAIRINFWSNFFVACISCVGTFVAMALGKSIYTIMPQHYTRILGSLLLILYGFYILNSSLKIKKNKDKRICESDGAKHYHDYIEHPELLDKDNSKEIEPQEAMALGLVLSINNIGIGVGASISGLNIYTTSLLSLLFSMIFIKLGFGIGNKISSSRLAKYSEYMSAVLIIVLGIYELIV